jgi:hypothetical protein
MRDADRMSGLAGAFLIALLMVAGASAADGDHQLVAAARNQDQPTVRALLNRHADVNARAADGSTALLWAAHWNDLGTADLMIRAGADANAANDFRITPLSLACTNGSAPLVEVLLKRRLFAAAAPSTAQQMQTAPDSQATLINNLLPGVVNITVFRSNGAPTTAMNAAASVPSEPKEILGSGFVIAALYIARPYSVGRTHPQSSTKPQPSDKQKYKTDRQLYQRIARRNFDAAIVTAAAQPQPAQHRHVVIPANRMTTRRTVRAGPRQIFPARQPVHQHVQKTADDRAQHKEPDQQQPQRNIHSSNSVQRAAHGKQWIDSS